MRIQVLARGGLSVYGADYDAKRNAATINPLEGETTPALIEYPSAPTSVSTEGSGLSATTPTVSGSQLSTTISGERGYVDIAATFGGARRTIRIQSGRVVDDDYGVPLDDFN
ncbi:hypothetical protein [Phenylobacterium sp.]|jgi:hypothetical protein|uniref:hypothetical protein n=1 Tax=Phenylobacterium sp. TaxID=1871053 RepID=UPI0027316C8E|nr:hypothetical protein [Phenylobacterium sp.]MDP1873647.1 hypothetical protein [Phenylobacterium sp.]